jgi:putative membrane protein
MMRTSLLFSMLVAGGLFLALAAWADDKKDDAKGDDRFVTEAAVGGLMEVKLGLLAMEHASNAEVKKFAQRMVDDHGKANKDLMGVADKKGIKVSIDLPKKHQETFDQLAKLKGAEFDRAYIKLMIMDHEEDLKEFDMESKSGKDPDVKEFAAKTLPVIREHLSMAMDIWDRIKDSK